MSRQVLASYAPMIESCEIPASGPMTTGAFSVRLWSQVWVIARLLMASAALGLVGRLLFWEARHSYGIATYDDIFTRLLLYRTGGSVSNLIKYLFSLHNEHRIVTTRLLIFADERLAGGRGTLLVVASNTLQMLAAIGCSIVVVRQRSRAVDLIQGLWLGSLILLLFVNGNLLAGLSFGFLVQHTIMGFLVVIAGWSIASAEQFPGGPVLRVGLLVRLAVLALIASLTLGNAPVILISAFVTAFVFRWPWTWTSLLGIMAGLHSILMILTTPVTGSKSTDPAAIFGFVTTYLGSPFTRLTPWPAPFATWAISPEACQIRGMIILVIPLAFALFQFLKPRRGRSVAAFGFVLCVAVIVTAVMAGITRAQFGIEAGAEKKYSCFSVVAWVGCLAIVVGVGREIGGRLRVLLPALISMAYATLLLVSWSGLDRETRIWGNFMQRNWTAAMAAFVGVGDRNTLLDNVYPDVAGLREYIQDISDRNRSVFSRFPFRMGDPATKLLANAHEVACRSEIEDLTTVRAQDLAYPVAEAATAYKIHGWTWFTPLRKPAGSVIAVDQDDRIVGTARTVAMSPRAEAWLGQEFNEPLKWMGYAIASSSKSMHFYALSIDWRVYCALGKEGDVR